MPSNLFIIIPCYNEGPAIRNTVTGLLEHGYKNIIVVDDGSEKAASEELTSLPVHIIRHPVNLGQGAALQTGMDYAKKLGADAVVHFDADGQHSADEIKNFVNALDECDMAIGTRFKTSAGKGQIPASRRLLLTVAKVINFLFCKIWLSDAHNGFRALNAKALQAINLTENGMAHATEIIDQAHRAKLRIKEVPCVIKYTDYSKGKGQKWYNSINILIDLIINKLM